LATYGQTGITTKAAAIVGIHRNNHRLWLREDPDYAVAFKEAHEQAGDAIAAEMRRRAIGGRAEASVLQARNMRVLHGALGYHARHVGQWLYAREIQAEDQI
jgi:hypothetical protein